MPQSTPLPLSAPYPSQSQRYASICLSLVLPFVMLIALLTGSLGVLWYWTGSKTISTLSQQLMHEMSERIGQAVQQHMRGAGAMLEVSFPQGLLPRPDIRDEMPDLRTRLWTATSLEDKPGGYVYYGNRAGQGIALLRKSATEAEVRLKTRAQDHRTYYRVSGIQATPEVLFTEKTLFDPRTRPWYRDALVQDRPIWTPVYIDFSAHDIVITQARRILAADGTPEGVVATDLFLAGLQRFMQQMPLPQGARAFILEADGALIAASDFDNIQQGADSKPQRVHAARSNDALLQALYPSLAPLFGTARAAGSSAESDALLVQAGGQSVQVAYHHVTDRAGLDWMAVVAVPHDDMLAGIRSHIVLVAALGLLALGLALAIGWRIFGGVARDMRTLTHAVRRVGLGDIHTPIEVPRNDEIGELAHNFHHMRHSLFTDSLTGVNNRSALHHILNTLTQAPAAGQGRAPFALLFIDLNKFKPLNDRWGHDNGDLALAEVAQRMRRHLPGSDVLARLGGDEFVAVLPGVADDAQARQACRALLAAIVPPLTTLQGIPAGEEVSVGASMGYALYPRDGADGLSLLRHADTQMYLDKGAGREK